MSIADLLPTSQKNAVSYKTLSEITGLTERQLREAIRRERRNGIPILTSHESGQSGVWLWDGSDRKEVERCIDTILNTGNDLIETALCMRERLD